MIGAAKMKDITFNMMLEDSLDMPVAFRSLCTLYDQESLKWAENYTDFYIMQFIVSGQGILRCRGKEYKLKSGSAFFIKIGTEFEYINTGNLKSAFLSTVGTAPETFAKSCIDDHLFYESVDLKKYLGFLEEIKMEYCSAGRKGRLSSLAYRLLSEFFSEKNNSEFSLNEQILSYIRQNFRKKITLSDISRDLGISVSKLCHDFKRAYGCSVFTRIKNLRLDYARELLSSNATLKIKDVAAYCGFEDLSYFCTAYKKRFEKSPGSEILRS